MRKTLHFAAKVIFNVVAILFGIIMLFSTIANDTDVAGILTEQVFKDKPTDIIHTTGKEPVRYKTWYSSVDDILEGNGEIAWWAQAEGTVLLKNEGGALPLAKGAKVSLYGVTAYDPMYCLDGAGNNKINDPDAYNGLSEVYRRQYFYEEFEKVGFDMNKNLYDWYNSAQGKHYWRRDYVGFNGLNSGLGYTGNSNSTLPALTEAAWDEITCDKNTSQYGKDTTAIYITGRMTNESADLNDGGGGSVGAVSGGNNDGDRSDDYLALTEEELSVIEALGKNYANVVVIFNQANPPQSDIPEILEKYGIEAALWVGFPGSDGIKAVADILAGNVNPSGRLSSAWYSSYANNPSSQNFGFNVTNVVNVEGMYVGYRYAETRYEDTLVNGDNYDYDASVSYPFGYGLSYSEFTYSDIEVVADPDPDKNYYSSGLMASNADNYTGNYGKAREEKRATGSNLGDCDDLIVKVKVTNTGNIAGKEVVQIYLQQPITDDDRAHGVQKPAVQLVGYGKTDTLEKGASQVLEIKVDANKWFAAYDAYANGGKGGYVLAAGDYKLVAAENSHEAVNSLYKAGLADGSELSAEFNDEYGAGSADRVKTVNVSKERSQSYRYWTQGTTDDIQNLFSDLDPNMDGDTSNDVKYFSRYDWKTTAAMQENLGGYGMLIGQDARNISNKDNTNSHFQGSSLTSEKVDEYAEYYGIDFDTTEYEFGWSNTDWQLVDLIGVEYDPARGASEEDVLKWEQLVGQMSEEDFRTLFSEGLRKTMAVTSIAKPGTNDQNASNGFEWAFGLGNGDRNGGFEGKNVEDSGFRNKFTPDSKIAYPTGYPCEGIIAASFNNEVAERVGEAIGEDALWGGTSGIYGFGLGLQRNPYHGRYGEFYSDDPLLTGTIGGYEIKGAQSKGLYVYNKHFVLNDQETNRTGYHAWINEQTFRQTYLRPFEIAIEIGDAMNVMIAFNKNGSAWTGSNYNLMTRWLRGEAGMAGFAISDYYPADGEQIAYGMLAGNCLLDGTSNSGYWAGNDARYDNRLVEAAIRILYTVANSNAMNFLGDDSWIETFDPAWYSMRDGLTVAGIVVFAAATAFVVFTTVWTEIDKRKKRA